MRYSFLTHFFFFAVTRKQLFLRVLSNEGVRRALFSGPQDEGFCGEKLKASGAY